MERWKRMETWMGIDGTWVWRQQWSVPDTRIRYKTCVCDQNDIQVCFSIQCIWRFQKKTGGPLIIRFNIRVSVDWLSIIILVGGLEHFIFFHILGTIIPFNVFQRGWNHQPETIHVGGPPLWKPWNQPHKLSLRSSQHHRWQIYKDFYNHYSRYIQRLPRGFSLEGLVGDIPGYKWDK